MITVNCCVRASVIGDLYYLVGHTMTLMTFIVWYIIAVSYTHLDVYKRQELQWTQGLLFW